VAKCLNGDERELVRWMLASKPPDWTRRWKIGVIAAAISAGCIALGGQLGWTLASAAFAVSAAVGMPFAAGSWLMLDSGSISGKLSPIHGCFPLDYGRASWVIAKLAWLRGLAWLPIGMIVGALMAWDGYGAPMPGVWMVAKGFGVWAAMMPVF